MKQRDEDSKQEIKNLDEIVTESLIKLQDNVKTVDDARIKLTEEFSGFQNLVIEKVRE